MGSRQLCTDTRTDLTLTCRPADPGIGPCAILYCPLKAEGGTSGLALDTPALKGLTPPGLAGL